MRWDGQQATAEREARLPGFPEAVVRTFDAPEALDVRFHEVHARSALNRVPGASRSRLPFAWTVNPYRGCTHACTYCAAPETPVLMGNGTQRAIGDLQVGDEIYGTEVRGRYRRYVRTRVVDHWSVVRPAYRVRLDDGTELIVGGDHRLLTERGWKHVAPAAKGQRPVLTTSNSLLGFGRTADTPQHDADYRRGYLTGMILGDGHVGSYDYERPDRRTGEVHRFRLALADTEALDRAAHFLELAGIGTSRFSFVAAVGGRRAVEAIRSQRRDTVEAVRALVQWPLDPSDSWRRGFLAGIFDAEGSASGALRISNSDELILGWTEASLRRFGFTTVREARAGSSVQVVRLLGGLRERMRFFHLTDPAITRKRDIEGTAIKSDADLGVVSVEPLGLAMRLYDITTGTGDFIAAGVVHHNCFARPTHEYLDFDAGRGFEREIVVKVNVPEVLRAELGRPSWGREHVALGTNTDPYQWVEKRYGLMRGIWEAMRDFANPCSVLTKSPLVLRDADLLEEIGRRTQVSACLSIPTWDEKAWRATEPHTPHPRARMEAVAELNRRGIPTGILVAPLMPGINDDAAQVERILEAAEEAGAVSVGGQALFLAGATRDVFMGWLRHARPDLVTEYERLYRGRSRLRPPDRDRVERPLREARRRRRSAGWNPGPERFDRPATTGGAGDPGDGRAGEGPQGGRGDGPVSAGTSEMQGKALQQEALF